MILGGYHKMKQPLYTRVVIRINIFPITRVILPKYECSQIYIYNQLVSSKKLSSNTQTLHISKLEDPHYVCPSSIRNL